MARICAPRGPQTVKQNASVHTTELAGARTRFGQLSLPIDPFHKRSIVAQHGHASFHYIVLTIFILYNNIVFFANSFEYI